MSVMLAQLSGQDHLVRNDVIRRRNAEVAYDRHENYNTKMQQKLERLENLIRGNVDSEEVVLSQSVEEKAVSKEEFGQLEAGQMKKISLPLGKTLEETIRLWRGVRTDAISVPQPTTADHQLASKASAEIRKVEAQIGLHQHARSEIDIATLQDGIEMAKMSSMEFPSVTEREVHKLQKRYEQAISSYSFHVQMKKSGFAIDLPSFYKIA